MAELLVGPRIKIDRAKKHLAELVGEIQSFHDRKPYEIIVDTQSEPGTEIFRAKIHEPIPLAWAGIVGDVLHNLRSALDITAVDLAIFNEKTSKSAFDKTKFPIGASKEEFDKRAVDYLRYVSDDARLMINHMKPYRGGTDAFYRLHQLDILDKHTLLIPVGATTKDILWSTNFSPALNAMWGFALPPEWSKPMSLEPFKRVFPINDGQELYRTKWETTVGGNWPPLQHKHEFIFEVAFGQGQIIDGEPLIPSLGQLIDFTEHIIDILARRVFKRRW